MSLLLQRLGESVEIRAEAGGLVVRRNSGNLDLSRRENWPTNSLSAVGGWRTAIEVEQLFELGLAEVNGNAVVVPYANFQTIDSDFPVRLIHAGAQPNPFLLKIDRNSDVGRSDFRYRYQFLLGRRPVHIERFGYYVSRTGTSEIFLLDHQMYSLVNAMDVFNALSPEEKTPQQSWLTFARVKGCAAEVGALLDGTLQSNDVVVPSTIGLDMHESQDGALSFLPRCPELATEEFQQAFERNDIAQNIYTLDRAGVGRVRVVLTDEQHEVLRRMKRVRRVTGELKDRLLEDPVGVFDGVAGAVEGLPYGERVTGVGAFKFNPVPRAANDQGMMRDLWRSGSSVVDVSRFSNLDAPTGAEVRHGGVAARPEEAAEPQSGDVGDRGGDAAGAASEMERGPAFVARGQNVLLIKTNEEKLEHGNVDGQRAGEDSRPLTVPAEFRLPEAFRSEFRLHPHQEFGVRWLQFCSQVKDRRGVLLADDMGVGKTIQILTFLAWCIESGRFPDLARTAPPFRPILIVVPLILLETRTWQLEMERFFANDGSIFWPVQPLHGSGLAEFRRDDAEGAELDIGKPVLDLARLQRHRVVITNYETLKNYQHSFAYFKDGKPLWSVIVSDEAQEYKVPSSKISHAIKALDAGFKIACTGTPVENRLLDLWNICDSVQPGLLGSAREFTAQFENDASAETSDVKMGELKRRLMFQRSNAFLLRRNKSEVAELPAKILKEIPCDMSGKEIEMHQILLAELRPEGGRSRVLAVLQRFALLSQHPVLLTGDGEDASVDELLSGTSKLRAVIQQLHVIRGLREKAIIFARHRAMQSILAKVIGAEFHLPVRIINGDTKMRASSLGRGQGAQTRNGNLHEFKQKHGFNVIVLSPFVAGVGLTITEANHVFHYGRWWNPAVESQATDRAYRIGQPKDVFVYITIMRDPSGRIEKTFDEKLDALMKRKYRLAEDFLRPLPAEDQVGNELLDDMRA